MHSPLVSSKRSYLARRTQSRNTANMVAERRWVLFLCSLFWCSLSTVSCLSSVDRDRELRIWDEREARRRVWESWVVNLERARSSTQRVWDSLLVDVGTSEELVTGVIPKSQIFLGCWSWRKSHKLDRSLDPWLWRANRLNHNGRCSASFAATGECSDESECGTWSSVGQSAKHCTRSCRIAWSNHDRAESFTSTDEEDACRSERLGKAASVLRQRRPFLRVDQEGRELRVWCVPECAWSFDVCSRIARRGHSRNGCNWCLNSELRRLRR